MTDSQLKILAIDDTPDNLTVLAALVADAFPGAKVFAALDGPKGLAIAKAEDPDMALLDVVMPGMDGFEVCRRLKADARTADIPVVFLTAITIKNETRIEALKAGGEGFLSKPFNEAELAAQIRLMEKVKSGNSARRREKERLAQLLEERTHELVEESDGHQRTAQELAVAEGRFFQIFSRMTEGFALHEIICDKAGKPVDYRFLEINPAFEKLTGLKREAVIGRTVLEIMPATEKRWIEAYGHVALTQETLNIEEFSGALGKFYSAKAFSPERGKFAVIFSDVTARKAAEDAVRLQNAVLSAQNEFALDGILVVDQAGTITSANRRFAEIWGIPAEILESRSDKRALQAVLDKLVRPEEFLKKVEYLYAHANEPSNDEILLKDGRRLDRYSAPVSGTDGRSYGRVWYYRDVTEQKRADERLHESEEKYRTLAEGTQDIPYSVDTSGVLLFIGPQARRYGLNPEKMVGQPFISFVHPGDQAAVMSDYVKTLETGAMSPSEFRIMDDKGGVHWIEEVGSLRRDTTGALIGFIGILRDITARRAAENALKESLMLTNAIVENNLDMIWAVDPEEFGLIGFNKALHTHFLEKRGIDIRKGMRPKDMFPDAAHIKWWEDAYKQALLAGGCTLEYPIAAQGKTLLASFTLLKEKGGVSGISVFAKDITESKRAAELLQANEARLAEAQRVAHVGSWDLDVKTHALIWSAETFRIFGFAPGEVAPTMEFFFEMVHPEDRAMMNAATEAAWHQKKPFDMDHRIVLADGAVRVVHEQAQVYFDDAGRPVRMLGNVQDVTELKQAEAVDRARLRLMQLAVTQSLDELLEEALNEAENLTGSLIGFCHFVEEDQKTLWLQNWSTRTKKDFCKADGKGSHYGLDKAGVWADCVRIRKPVIHNNYASLQCKKGMPPGHAPVMREMVVPVMRGKMVVAVMGVGNKAADYTHKDLETLSLLADIFWEIIMRKRAEEALLAEKNQLDAIVETSPVGLLILDEKRNIVRANSAAADICGAKMEDIAHHLPGEALGCVNASLGPRGCGYSPKCPLCPLLQSLDSLLASGTLVHAAEMQMEFKRDGKLLKVWLLAGAGRILLNGRPHAVVSLTDITEKKSALEAEERSRIKYAAIFGHSPIAIEHYDAEGSLLGVNEACVKMFGVVDIHEITNANLFRDPNVSEEAKASLRRREIVHIEAPFDFEKVKKLKIYRTTRSGVAMLNYYIAPMVEGGKITGYVAQVQDVTERRRAENELKLSEQRFSDAFEHTGLGMALVSLEGRWLKVNTALTDIFGYGVAELEGQPFRAITHPEDVESSLQAMRDLLAGKIPSLKTEKRYIHKSGRQVWSVLSVTLVRDDSGEPLYFVTQISDITARKKAEIAAQRHTELLSAINASGDLRALMQKVTGIIMRWTGCEAVGIRLKDGEDFPYYETKGFPPEFLRAENSLCARDQAGELVRDSVGNPVIECMCGNVLCGRFNPELPFFSAKGSFWSNCTTELLASTTEADRQARTRNRCNGEGYESVALIPLRSGINVIGLLQVNSKQKNLFDEELLSSLENAADQLAMAVAHMGAQTALRESERRLKKAQATAKIGNWEMNLKTREIWVSDEVRSIYGFSKNEKVTPDLLQKVRLERYRPGVSLALKTLEAGSGYDIEYEIKRQNTGELLWLRSQTELVIGKGGETKVIGVVQDITDSKRAQEKIKASLEEKEVLMKEIHHRVKNNLQVVSSLLNLQAKAVKDESVAAVLTESRARVRAMALVHEILYRSNDFSRLNMREYAARLVDGLKGISPAGGKVRFETDVCDCPLSVDTAVSLGLILSELVSNALKHAFDGGRAGTVKIRLSSENGAYCLTVEDDGPGLPADYDLRKEASLGMQLVTTLAGQISGTVEAAPGAGARFLVRFPG